MELQVWLNFHCPGPSKPVISWVSRLLVGWLVDGHYNQNTISRIRYGYSTVLLSYNSWKIAFIIPYKEDEFLKFIKIVVIFLTCIRIPPPHKIYFRDWPLPSLISRFHPTVIFLGYYINTYFQQLLELEEPNVSTLLNWYAHFLYINICSWFLLDACVSFFLLVFSKTITESRIVLLGCEDCSNQ